MIVRSRLSSRTISKSERSQTEFVQRSRRFLLVARFSDGGGDDDTGHEAFHESDMHN
jgi:hypothetical protein